MPQKTWWVRLTIFEMQARALTCSNKKPTNCFFILCATLKCWALKQEKQQKPFFKSLVWLNWESNPNTNFEGERSNLKATKLALSIPMHYVTTVQNAFVLLYFVCFDGRHENEKALLSKFDSGLTSQAGGDIQSVGLLDNLLC